jgi:type II secretory pathway component PulF
MPAISKLIVGSFFGIGAYGVWEYLNDTVFFIALIGLIIFGIVAFCRIVLFKSDSARESYEQVKMTIPAIGPAVRGFALAKFGRAFGAMYSAGLPLNAAVRVAGRASGNAVIARATSHIIESVERGRSVSHAFYETRVFPKIVTDMLHTGEQTGNMDSMMEKAAEYLENEASARAHMNAHIFATVVYLLVAIMVAFAVISFYAGGGASSAGGMLTGPAGDM